MTIKPAILGGPLRFTEPVFVTRPRVPSGGRFHAFVDEILRDAWFTNNGPLVRELERQLQVFLGSGFCSVLASGTTAIQIALRTLGVRGEVITTPFTFPATVHAISSVGLTPVFCDIEKDTYNLSPYAAAALVSERTSAVLPVHVFGNPCDVVGIGKLASRNGLRVIYDAAHAFGVRHMGHPIASYGDLSTFSFHATKLFHTAEGGAVVGGNISNEREIALLRNFGISSEDSVCGVGVNGKMSELHAALGLSLLTDITEEIEARSRLSLQYDKSLFGVPGITPQRIARETERNYSYYPVEINEELFGLSRDDVHVALRAENIFARRYFWPLCSENPSYSHLPTANRDSLPNAHRLASRILCLPLWGGLPMRDVSAIAEAVLNIRVHAREIRAKRRGW